MYINYLACSHMRRDAPFLALDILGTICRVIQPIFAFTPEKASELSAYEPLVVLAAIFPTRQMPFPFAGNCWGMVAMYMLTDYSA